MPKKEDRSNKRILNTFLTINEKQSNITPNLMHQHVCTIILLVHMINFNLIQNIIVLYFNEHKNSQLNHFISIS